MMLAVAGWLIGVSIGLTLLGAAVILSQLFEKARIDRASHSLTPQDTTALGGYRPRVPRRDCIPPARWNDGHD